MQEFSPNLPIDPVKVVLLSSFADTDVKNGLIRKNIQPILVHPAKFLNAPEAAHPDMLFCVAGKGKVICEPSIYLDYVDTFSKQNFILIKGSTFLSCNYPSNIAYNIARVSKFAFHNLKYTDRTVRETFEEEGILFIHTNQGYAKCSMCVVSEKAIITADSSIANAALRENFDVLKISEGSISLPGHPYGFFGGASGLISKNTLCMTGTIEKHPDLKRILEFLQKYQVNACCLSKHLMTDIGSIVPLF